MRSQLKSLARSAIVYIPHAEHFKVSLQRKARNLLKVPFEREFRALRLLPDLPGALYVDVGGHHGFAIDAILLHKRNCRIASFEPNPDLVSGMEKRFQGDPRVTVRCCALGDEEGEFTLHVPVYRHHTFYGLGSLHRELAATWLKEGGRLRFFNPRSLRIDEHPCSVVRLDSLGLDPFFLKLDVQGHELHVLEGGQQTIRRSRPIILIELSDISDRAISFLLEFGYRPYAYVNDQFSREYSGRMNAFLMTDQHINSLSLPVRGS